MFPVRKTSVGFLAVAAAVVLAFGWLAWRLVAPPQGTKTFPAKALPAVLPEPTSSASLRYLRVPILVYHSIAPYRPEMTPLVRRYTVPPESLEEQFRYLHQNGYTVIPFGSLVDAMTSAGAPLPAKPVVLTFDDGWEDLYREAFPLLLKYNDTATFFVFTNGIGAKDFMTWPQLAAMQAAGMDIESHSISHPYLSAITDKADLWKEIEGSREIIASHLGREPDIFAYPFGSYNELEIAMLKAAGYRAARADPGSTLPAGAGFAATATDELYKLPGLQVTEDFARFVSDLKAHESE
ncbi:MAG TPA: polysaccharide deacetylase family protein [Candidatus Acidoferrum sp.]|nr:polysaccharide deacetylase family protein [Candidatus Acidoferrum sp.]